MTNAELIEALRNCEVHGNGGDCRKECPYVDQDCGACIHEALLHDAADALEATEKRIAELIEAVANRDRLADDMNKYIWKLEMQLLKEGECEAKKPKTVKETEYSFYCDCPTCGGRLISNVDGEWCAGSFDRFCRMCGQKIDWSEYCGWSNKPNCGARMKGEHDGNAV